ncbi:MAG: FliA/WhiG family RNA polymerase sigma factor [Oligoflexia bacterium]|nr:FliA/WhiG family RNA polymerase sigma factor [Oligoflexia bacterium]MBF0365078.1 FliA/WhiG family RNA polymerase sigma factor [Oligoflexia bacterium]
MKSALSKLKNLPEIIASISIKRDAGEKSRQQVVTETVVTEYVPFIKFIARKFLRKLPRSLGGLEFDELVSCGVIGLIDALKKFDPTKENKFKTYAEFRIRGAILDELRNIDWIPRSVKDKGKKVEQAEKELQKRLGRKATEGEVCEVLGIPLTKYQKLLDAIKRVSLVSFEDLVESNQNGQDSTRNFHKSELSASGLEEEYDHNGPFSMLSLKMAQKKIYAAMETLPSVHKKVLHLYYFEGLKMNEISGELKITNARVSQLHTEAVSKLKAIFSKEFTSVADVHELAA